MARRLPILFSALLALGACNKAPPAPTLHQIHIVGSSAAYPFSTAVAESFMRQETDAIAPLAQADGTSAGIARFCAGIGAAHPDLVGAARPMTAAEHADCAKNGIADVTEIPFGWSALVLVTRPDTQAIDPTRAAIGEALTGNAKVWAAIDPALPPLPIALHGPNPPADLDLLVHAATLRQDGLYRPHGADPELVVKAVLDTPGAIGIVPWATAARHADTLRLLPLDGVMPSAETIATGRYPARLPLILYAKPDEIRTTPGLRVLLKLYAAGWADGGAFAALGLVPLDAAGRAKASATIAALARP
ncbi:MAG: phosphate transporter substrate-binding protein [Sphingomonas bacterium]|nr:phosphate transporter substrate-binding protein [Sphingomonas bacterium]